MSIEDPERPLVLIGNPHTVFVQRTARVWLARGHDVIVVSTGNAAGTRDLPSWLPVRMAAREELPPWAVREVAILWPILAALETELAILDDPTRTAATDRWGAHKAMPSISPAIWDAIVISHVVRGMNPRIVFGQEAFAYGLATALCYGAPRGLMIWGGDVDFFADKSPVARAMVRFALQSVDSVLVTADTVARRAIDYFGVQPHRCHKFSFGVDRIMFRPAREHEKAAARLKLGLDPEAPTVVNLRRFDPLWGADVVLQAFFTLAERDPRVQFILPAGEANDARLDAARAAADARGFGPRFRFVSGQIALEHYAELLHAADAAIALAQWEEPLSSSVLQGLATGLPLVASDNATLRAVADLGAAPVLVPADDATAAADALSSLLADPARASRIVRHNLDYVDREQDETTALERLLRLLEDGTDEGDLVGLGSAAVREAARESH